jgi:hypothetical protein
MSHPLLCKHCLAEYNAYKEQQPGFGYEITIKIWICPKCGHRKSIYSEEDLKAWEQATKYKPPKTKNRDFESIYKNPNKSGWGEPTVLKPNKHSCGDGCKCEDGDCSSGGNDGCGGGCGGCTP